MNKRQWKQHLKTITDPRELARTSAVYNILVRKKGVGEAAAALGKSKSWARKWIKRYHEDGPNLKDRPRSGRPPHVPATSQRPY